MPPQNGGQTADCGRTPRCNHSVDYVGYIFYIFEVFCCSINPSQVASTTYFIHVQAVILWAFLQEHAGIHRNSVQGFCQSQVQGMLLAFFASGNLTFLFSCTHNTQLSRKCSRSILFGYSQGVKLKLPARSVYRCLSVNVLYHMFLIGINVHV